MTTIGEGNGNPLHYSYLENPRDGSLVGCRLWGHTESDTTDVDLAAAPFLEWQVSVHSNTEISKVFFLFWGEVKSQQMVSWTI